MSFRLKIILGVAVIQSVFLFMIIWSGLEILKTSNEEALLNRAQTKSVGEPQGKKWNPCFRIQ